MYVRYYRPYLPRKGSFTRQRFVFLDESSFFGFFFDNGSAYLNACVHTDHEDDSSKKHDSSSCV